MNDETKKCIEDLTAQLEALKAQVSTEGGAANTVTIPKVEVAIPPPRKLSKFNGENVDVRDWVEDARDCIKGIAKEQQVPYIKRHLEGEARTEVRVSAKETATAEEVLEILLDCFKVKKSAGKIKKMMLNRERKDNETVRDFTRFLLDKAEKLKDGQTAKDRFLRECLIENIRCDKIKEKLEEMVEDDDDVSFDVLRAKANKMGDKESSGSTRTRARVNEVEVMESDAESEDFESAGACSAVKASHAKPWTVMAAALEKMTETNQQMLNALTQHMMLTSNIATQQAYGPSVPFSVPQQTHSVPQQKIVPTAQQQPSYLPNQLLPSQTNQNSGKPLSEVRCYRCNNFGHYKFSPECPLSRSQGQSQGRKRSKHGRGGTFTPQVSNFGNQGNSQSPQQ